MQKIYIKVTDTQLPESVRVSIYSHILTAATPERELTRVRRAAAKRHLSTVSYELATILEYAHHRAAMRQAAHDASACESDFCNVCNPMADAMLSTGAL